MKTHITGQSDKGLLLIKLELLPNLKILDNIEIG